MSDVGLRCPSCGAPAAADATRCEYCQARLASASCPSCFALLFEGAAFCSRCGTARSRSEGAEARHVSCPACGAAMSWVHVGEADLLECGRCEGTWVEAETFERICADRESQAAVIHASAARAPAPALLDQPVRYRPCPRCRKMMNRVNFGTSSGAIVDVCKGHGTFLDRGELHRIVEFIRSGGLERARKAEREARAEEQRRVRNLERMPDRITRNAPPEGFSWKESAILSLVSALFVRR